MSSILKNSNMRNHWNSNVGVLRLLFEMSQRDIMFGSVKLRNQFLNNNVYEIGGAGYHSPSIIKTSKTVNHGYYLYLQWGEFSV